VDTAARNEIDLGNGSADLRDDRSSFSHVRGVAFDPTGRRLLYLRKSGDADDVVVRELATGAESLVAPGDGELWRADFDASGEWVVLRVIATDSNANGKLEWPAPRAEGPWIRCNGPLPRFAAWEHPGDEVTPRVARVTGGAAVDAPGLIVPLGDSLVERDVDGAIARVKSTGERTTIAKKACAAKLLFADAAREAIVFTCDNKKGHADVRLVSRGVEKSLGLELSVPAGDHFGLPASRLLPLYPGPDTVLVDVDGGEIVRLSPGDRVIAGSGDNVLVLRGRSVVLHSRGAAEQTLSQDVDPLAHVVKSGALVAISPVIVDVAQGVISGHTDGRALALAHDASILVASGCTADATHMAVGPLIWEKMP
jgi:hypothetical protein